MPAVNGRLLGAALLGAAAGMRTFTPEAVMAARGRLTADDRVRGLLVAAAAGELIGDKLAFVPARTTPLPYLGRVASGAFCGNAAAGAGGALAGAIASAATTMGGYQVRRLAAGKTEVPDLLVAVLEDATAVLSAAAGAALAGD